MLKGGLEILGDHSCLSKQELSCPGQKGLLSWVYQVFSGCSRVCRYSVYYRERQLIWGCLYPSPAFPVPVFLTQRIQFLKTFMRPSVTLPTQQKSLLEDGRPPSSGTLQGAQDLQSPVLSRTAITLGGTLRSELESLFQVNVTHQGYKDLEKP